MRLNTRPFPLMRFFLLQRWISLSLCVFLCVRSSENISIRLIIIDKVVFMHIAFLNAHQGDTKRERKQSAQVMIEFAYFVATFAVVSVDRICFLRLGLSLFFFRHNKSACNFWQIGYFLLPEVYHTFYLEHATNIKYVFLY